MHVYEYLEAEGRPFKYYLKVSGDKMALYNRELLGGVVYSKENESISKDGIIRLPVSGTPIFLSTEVILGMSPARPDTIYAMDGNRHRILRSDDRGEAWRLYAQVDWWFGGLSSRPTFAVDPLDPNRIYALSKSRDLARFDGKEWNELGILRNVAGDVPNYVQFLAFDPRHPNILYATTYGPGLPFVFRSLDSGATWRDISANLPRLGGDNHSLAVSPHTGEVLHGSVFGTWVYPPPYDSPKAIYHTLGHAGR